MGRPLISVIIPVYNAIGYIEKCIVSNLRSAQKCCKSTGAEVEVICVDDGSTDGTSMFLDNYASTQKNNALKIIHQINGGVSVARNKGLEEACGAWVRFVDADDWVDETLDQQLTNIIYSTPEIDCIAFAINWLDDAGNIDHKMGHDKPQTIISGDCLLGSKIYSQYAGMVWNKIYRKSIIDIANIKFRLGMQPGEDDLFSMMFLANNVTVRVAPEIEGYYYRMTPGSAIHTMNIRKSMFAVDVFLEMYEVWRRTRGQGLRIKLCSLAKAVIFLGRRESMEYRCACIDALVENEGFNKKLMPYVAKNAEVIVRLFALLYVFLPKSMRRALLKKI